MPKVPVCELPVMKAHCKTCPFRPNERGHWSDIELATAVTERTLFKAQQICHGTDPTGRKPQNRCKGSYDHNKMLYDRMGLGHLLK